MAHPWGSTHFHVKETKRVEHGNDWPVLTCFWVLGGGDGDNQQSLSRQASLQQNLTVCCGIPTMLCISKQVGSHPLNPSRYTVMDCDRAMMWIPWKWCPTLWCPHISTFRLCSLSHSKGNSANGTLVGLGCLLHSIKAFLTELVFTWQLFRVLEVIETDRTSVRRIIVIFIISRRSSGCSTSLSGATSSRAPTVICFQLN